MVVRKRCFLDVSIDGDMKGRMIIELFNDIVPMAAENFRALCTGEMGTSVDSGVLLHYKGTHFNRILVAGKGFAVYGGELAPGESISIYGPTFEDEIFGQHDQEGILTQVNNGPNTNNSRFMILTSPQPRLDGRNVVFGQIVKGLDILHLIKRVQRVRGNPSVAIKIENSGEIPHGGDDGLCNFFQDGDYFPDWPADLDNLYHSWTWYIRAARTIRNKGEEYFEDKNYNMALKKYQKAFMYLDSFFHAPEENMKYSMIKNVRAKIFVNLSATKLKLKDATGALTDAELAFQDASNSSYFGMAFYYKGKALMALGEPKSAVENFHKATSCLNIPKKRRYNALAKYYKGKALMASDDPKSTVVSFKEARRWLDKHPTEWRHSAKAMYYEGMAYQLLGNMNSAIKSFIQARAWLPANSPYMRSAFFHEGQAFMALGNPESAVKSYKNARDLMPNNATVDVDAAIVEAELAAALKKAKIDDGAFPV